VTWDIHVPALADYDCRSADQATFSSADRRQSHDDMRAVNRYGPNAVAGAVMIRSALEVRRRTAWRTPVLAIVICPLLAAVLALGGCGSGATHDARSRGGGPPPLEREAVYSFLAASGTQLAQGNAFYLYEARLINLGTAQCMRAHGFGAADESFIRYDEEYLNPPQGSPVAPGFEGMDSSGVPGLVSIALLSRKGSLLMPVPIGALPRPYNDRINCPMRRE
jgi:hypothetical protein